MEQDIIHIVSTIFEMPISSITSEANMKNIEQWNSMNHMKLVLALEEEFNLSISDDDAIELLSIADICQFIRERSS